ncbi:MAG TPA: 3-methyl-2-oxobutanoate hydroxymethyltransferase [Leptospiraceae bacterium]|nr:3-methyl-2-oxobutanoate hydroxymethyltransferase [Spirochaetaceae bacterium]HBS05530.1 3-methyl-2-oxobutanoate hydroxymethyltransferase [Leptospiraceae bacterium]|tara:strand:- start:202 stop:1020 length:819 start_codon:yes stop_codon:yes gene_type:complete
MAQKRLKYPSHWLQAHAEGRKISMATCYDFAFARLIARSSVDAILVGDSMGMVVQGKRSTVPVTLDQIIYHAEMVRRGAPEKFLIVDMPAGTYHSSVEAAIENAMRIMKETDADALKLEGSTPFLIQVITRMVESGIPVMGHSGLTPQSVLTAGGFRVQGKTSDSAALLKEAALSLQAAGCFGLLLELVEANVAKNLTSQLSIPTVGIGSGADTSGQVLVLHDILGLDPDFSPRHTKKYADLADPIIQAFDQYTQDVQKGAFPGPENSFYAE